MTDHRELAFDFMGDPIAHERNRIQILEFNLGPKGVLPHGSQREIRFTPKAALFHVSVTNVQIDQDISQCLEIRHHLVSRLHIGFGHDFQQWSTRTVEIYRANVMTKMQARSLSELVRMVIAADPDKAGLG